MVVTRPDEEMVAPDRRSPGHDAMNDRDRSFGVGENRTR
jgi:hypothetical protein